MIHHSRRLADTLLKLARLRVSDLPDELEIFRLVNEATAECLDVERVGVWLHTPDKKSIECVDIYIHSKDMHGKGVRLDATTYPAYFAALEKDRTIVAKDALNHHATACMASDYLIPNRIASMLDAPIYHDGEVIGVICCEHVGEPREWDQHEQNFSGSLAACTAWLLEQFKHDRAETELKRHHEAMERASRLEAMGRLAAGCAHDFNNILVTIAGYAELMRMEIASLGNPRLIHDLKHLQSAAASGQAITHQLLSFARQEPADPQPVDMARFMADIAGQIEAVTGCHLKFTWEAEAGLPAILGVGQQLAQVAINLASNSRDAMPSGGNLKISVAAVNFAEGEHHGLPPGKYVLWRFVDDGPGLPAVVFDHLFEPFITTKPPGIGTGLGLATSYGIITRLGGEIDAFNLPEGGAEFRIYLPVATEV